MKKRNHVNVVHVPAQEEVIMSDENVTETAETVAPKRTRKESGPRTPRPTHFILSLTDTDGNPVSANVEVLVATKDDKTFGKAAINLAGRPGVVVLTDVATA
jgi:hypothetical protein